MTLGRGWRVVFVVLGAAIVGFFLVRAVVASWAILTEAISDPPWLLLGLELGLAMLAMVWVAAVWVWLLAAMESPLPLKVGTATYFVGEATKYLPGALWPVVGRGEIAVRFGADRVSAYTSVLYSLLLNFVLAGMIAALIAAPFALAGSGRSAAVWLLALLPIGLLALHPKLLSPIIAFANRHTGLGRGLVPLSWVTSLRFVALYIPAWMLIGLISLVGARIVGVDPPIAALLFATYLAWVAGFLAVLAPTGLGVREAVFVAIVGPSIGVGPASAIALLSRVAFVFADAIGAIVGSVVVGSTARRTPETAATFPSGGLDTDEQT